MKKKISLIIILFGLALVFQNVLAQESSSDPLLQNTPPPQDISSPFAPQSGSIGTAPANTANSNAKSVVIADVDIYNAKIDSQDGNKLNVSFDLTNHTGIQPNVKYAVDLVVFYGDVRVLFNEKVYDESLNLGEKESVHKTVEYDAPAFAKGDFEVWITAKNDKGLPLANNMIQKIKLDGDGSFVEIQNDSCFVSVEGDKSGKKYFPNQGTDIASSENLIATCKVKNNFGSAVAVTPNFNLFDRSVFSSLVSTQKGDSVTINSGETKEVSLTLPKANQPQAYNAVLTLSNDQGKTISNSITFHYILQGASATIKNLVLDKDYYAEGDTAKITFSWLGSADKYPGSRSGGMGDKVESDFVEINITNDQNQSCIAPFQKKTTEINSFEGISIPITTGCLNPKVTAVIKDKDGNVLDQSSFNISSKNAPQKQTQPEKSKKSNIIVFFAVLFILLIIIIGMVYLRRKKSPTIILLFLIVFGGLLLGKVNAGEAKTMDICYTIPGYDYDGNLVYSTQCFISMSFSLSPDYVYSGNTITAYGESQYIPWAFTAKQWDVSMWATVNGQYRPIFDRVPGYAYAGGSQTYTVENVSSLTYSNGWFTGTLRSWNAGMDFSNTDYYTYGIVPQPSHAQSGPVCNRINGQPVKRYCDAWCPSQGAWCDANSWTSSCNGSWYNNVGYYTPVQCCADSDCGAGCTCVNNSCKCSCTATLSSSPASPIDYNSSATLTWSSASASSCTISGGSYNSGQVAAQGTVNTPNLTANTTYTITCNSNIVAGATCSNTATVNVKPTPRKLTISLNSFGKVNINPPNVSCVSSSPNCVQTFNDGALVTLTANGLNGGTFKRWNVSGCSDSSSTCSIRMDADRYVNPDFEAPCIPTCSSANQICEGDHCTDCSGTVDGTKNCPRPWKEVAP